MLVYFYLPFGANGIKRKGKHAYTFACVLICSRASLNPFGVRDEPDTCVISKSSMCLPITCSLMPSVNMFWKAIEFGRVAFGVTAISVITPFVRDRVTSIDSSPPGERYDPDA